MECKDCEESTINYGSELFCKVCGMDIGLESIKKSYNNKTKIYCCEDCSKS